MQMSRCLPIDYVADDYYFHKLLSLSQWKSYDMWIQFFPKQGPVKNNCPPIGLSPSFSLFFLFLYFSGRLTPNEVICDNSCFPGCCQNPLEFMLFFHIPFPSKRKESSTMCISGCKVFGLKTLCRHPRMNLCVFVCVALCEHVQRGFLATDVKVIPVLFLTAQLIASFLTPSFSSPFHSFLCIFYIFTTHISINTPTHSSISRFSLSISILRLSIFFVSLPPYGSLPPSPFSVFLLHALFSKA